MQDASLLRASRFEYWTRTGRNEEEGTEWKVKVRLSAIFRTSLHTSLCAFERALKKMSCSLRWHLSFFSRISVTRLFVKYDSSFSLWRWWRRNKYRQTRIFIKLQRDTNTCKMSACRIKIPQKRQTKSEDASLEPDDRSLFDRPNGSSGVSETAITDTETIEDLSLKWKLQVFGLNWLSWKMGHAVHR